MRTLLASLIAVGGLVAVVAGTPAAQSPPPAQAAPAAAKPYTTWTQYLGGAHSSQYTALDQINTSTVSRLKVLWTYPVGERQFVFNPIVVDGVMYVLAKSNALVALDAATGKELWEHPNTGAVGARGLNYWQSPDGRDRRLFYLNAGMLTSIDARTGATVESFGEMGKIDLRPALGRGLDTVRPLQTSNPGRVYDDLIILSLPAQGAGHESTPGDVQAYDVRTGTLRWVFHSVPRPGEFGADTWPEGRTLTAGGVHNWSELTVDEENGIVFVPFGTARYDFFGGDREGSNLFANSLVALDAKSGTRLWHYQTIHHDLWDWDLPQAPKLLTIQQNGRPVQVVAQATKHGFLFVFERRTGTPIWPIEERRVPASDLPGEKAWATQPFPTKPAPFARQSLSEKDVNPWLPAAEQEEIRAELRSMRNEGLFTPPSLQSTLQMPGHNGGANWGSSAVDPVRGEFYVVTKESPTSLKAIPGDPSAPRGGGAGRAGAAGVGALGAGPAGAGAPPPAAPETSGRFRIPIDFMLSSMNLSKIGPPWSTITAYDLNTGNIKWQVPNGTVAGLPEIPQWKGNTGAHWPRGGPLVTAGGLLFVGTGSDRKFRAYDRDNGKVVWETDVEATPDGVPASFDIDGRQIIVVPVAGGAGSNAVRINGVARPAGPGGYIAYALAP